MTYKYVIYEKEGNVAKITLNKPEKLNCFDEITPGQDHIEIMDAFKQGEEDDDVKVIVVKGAGRAFSTGQDLTRVGLAYGWETPKSGEKVRRPSQRIRLKKDRYMFESARQIFLCPKLTIAQVHGYALDGGLDLALMCDFVIAAEGTMFGTPGSRLGFAGGGQSIFPFLVHTIGLKRAVYLYVTGKLFTAEEVLPMGLITKVVPLDKLEEEVARLAKGLCLLPRDGIALGKAYRHECYDQMGLTIASTTGYVHHTLFTNVRWEPDEYSFFKERREDGAKVAFHERDARYADLI